MLINRNFTLLWSGQAVSLVGDAVFDTTLLLWVSTVLLPGRAYAPLVSTAVLVIAAVVTLVVAPVAGVLVDRWDKRRVALAADLVRAGLITVLAAVAWSRQLPVPAVLVLIGVTVALASATAQFFNPSRFVLIGDVVPAAVRGRAAGYGQATAGLAGILGPAVAGPLMVGLGPQWALVINAGSFLVSFAAIRAVRVPPVAAVGPPARRHFSAEFSAGLRMLLGNRVLVAVLVTIVLVMLGAGATATLAVYFVPENLHVDPERWFGVLLAAFGGGGLAGALVGGRLGDRFGHARMFAGSAVAFGVLFVVYSRMTSLGAAIVVIALLNVPIGVLNTVLTPLLLAWVPREYLGRAVAVFGPVNRCAAIVSMLVAGAVAGALPPEAHVTVAGMRFGRIDSIFLVGGLLSLAGGLYATRALRGADRLVPAPADTGRSRAA